MYLKVAKSVLFTLLVLARLHVHVCLLGCHGSPLYQFACCDCSGGFALLNTVIYICYGPIHNPARFEADHKAGLLRNR